MARRSDPMVDDNLLLSGDQVRTQQSRSVTDLPKPVSPLFYLRQTRDCRPCLMRGEGWHAMICVYSDPQARSTTMEETRL